MLPSEADAIPSTVVYSSVLQPAKSLLVMLTHTYRN